MYALKKSVSLTATLVMAMTLALAGCGKNEGTATNGNGVIGAPAGALPYNGSAQALPGGGARVSFTGSNVYLSPQLLSGGQVGAGKNCYVPGMGAPYGCYCGLFSGPMQTSQYNYQQTPGYVPGSSYYNPTMPYYTPPTVAGCWLFSNYTHAQTGIVSQVSSVAVPVGAPGTLSFTGSSLVEPGTTVTIVATPVAGTSMANVTGYLDLSPNFVRNNFPSGTPAFMNISFDFGLNGQAGASQNVNGGILLYTGPNTGFFISI